MKVVAMIGISLLATVSASALEYRDPSGDVRKQHQDVQQKVASPHDRMPSQDLKKPLVSSMSVLSGTRDPARDVKKMQSERSTDGFLRSPTADVKRYEDDAFLPTAKVRMRLCDCGLTLCKQLTERSCRLNNLRSRLPKHTSEEKLRKRRRKRMQFLRL